MTQEPSSNSISSPMTGNSLDSYMNTLRGMSPEQLTLAVKKMTLEQKEKLSQMLAEQAVDRAKDDLLFFLDKMVYTQDEHDSRLPIKPIPMYKQYMRELAYLFLTEPLLLVEKSRQMMVTWIFVACHLWDAMFHDGRRIFFQSKKEVDADHLVQRAKIIYESIPEPYRTIIYSRYPARVPMSYLKLEFPQNRSIIQGTAQGADVIRQYTASRIFSDEMGFQEKAEEAFIAAKPTIVGGGTFIGVSTPNFKNFWYLLKSDQI